MPQFHWVSRQVHNSTTKKNHKKYLLYEMLPAQKLKGYGVLKIIKKYSFQADVLILNKIIDELINSTMGTCSAGFR